jgi:hypothetical protein
MGSNSSDRKKYLDTANPDGSPRRWCGVVPNHCDLCSDDIDDVFVDGKMQGGGWAFMCIPCHAERGLGFGLGQGQEFTSDPETGYWERTRG